MESFKRKRNTVNKNLKGYCIRHFKKNTVNEIQKEKGILLRGIFIDQKIKLCKKRYIIPYHFDLAYDGNNSPKAKVRRVTKIFFHFYFQLFISIFHFILIFLFLKLTSGFRCNSYCKMRMHSVNLFSLILARNNFSIWI